MMEQEMTTAKRISSYARKNKFNTPVDADIYLTIKLY